MIEPSVEFVEQLVDAVHMAKHPGPAMGALRGFLWACYPEWWEEFLEWRENEHR